MITARLQERGSKPPAGVGSPFSLTGGPLGEAQVVLGQKTPRFGATLVNSLQPFVGLSNVLFLREISTSARETTGEFTRAISAEYAAFEHVTEVLSTLKEVGSGLVAVLANVVREEDSVWFLNARRELAGGWFERERSALDLEWRASTDFIRASLERPWREIDQSLNIEELVPESISGTELLPEPEPEEEPIEVRPRIAFGSLPVPGKSKPIRLSSKVRGALPPEVLPRTFSVAIGEETEP